MPITGKIRTVGPSKNLSHTCTGCLEKKTQEVISVYGASTCVRMVGYVKEIELGRIVGN